MTALMHRHEDPFEDRLQRARLGHLMASEPALTVLAEHYVGVQPALPIEI